MSSSITSRLGSMVPTITATKGLSPAATIIPYTHGLKGVNIDENHLVTYLLWLTLVGLGVSILLMRFAQMVYAHLRHLFNLTSTPAQQSYWSEDRTAFWPWIKKYVLYAPVWHQRHNKEFQLSRAINMGTIPSRLHTILLGLYIVSNITYCTLLDYKDKNRAEFLADLRGRSGNLSVINMVPLVLLAGRNNPLIPLLRVSFDTFNLFHRWIGRIAILEAVVHTIAWGVNEVDAKGYHGVSEALRTSTFIQYGTVGTVAMIVMFLISPGPIRHAYYETFLHLHQVLAFATILGVYVHAKAGPLPQLWDMILIILIWSLDRGVRWFRIIYCNLSSQGWTTVTVEALPAEACRVTFQLKRPWRYTPGCHVYAYLPSVSLWMSHPFSIAWCEESPLSDVSLEKGEMKLANDGDLSVSARTAMSISLIMSKRTGMTSKLYNKAKASPTGIITMSGAVEGPYGGYDSLHSYGTAILFAGGVGITHQLSFVRELVAGHYLETTATRKVVLIWSVRTVDQLEWVRPWMDEILSMPRRREILKIMLFVTKPNRRSQVVSPSATVQMIPGRANPRTIIAAEMATRIGATVVTVCGPGALADDVRAAAREKIEDGSLDFMEESFTW